MSQIPSLSVLAAGQQSAGPSTAGRPGGREAVRLGRHEPFQPPVRLVLQPQPEPLHYALTARWEEQLHGELTRTIVRKELTLSSEPDKEGLLVTWAVAPPVLSKPSVLPMEELVLLLAGLYRRLVLRTSPTGQVLALANHAEVAQAWAETRQELAARYGAEPNDTIELLRAAVEAQVQQPERLLASLQYDYAYQLLLADVYQQRFESGFGYLQPKAFPLFFADTGLHFQERLQLGPPTAAGRVVLQLRGQLDEGKTDRPAIAAQVAAALALVPTVPAQPPPDPAALAFVYRASYELDAATGWPFAVEATVSCQSPAGYAKEYDLTIERL